MVAKFLISCSFLILGAIAFFFVLFFAVVFIKDSGKGLKMYPSWVLVIAVLCAQPAIPHIIRKYADISNNVVDFSSYIGILSMLVFLIAVLIWNSSRSTTDKP